MTKIHPTSRGTLSAKQLKHAFACFVLFFATMLLTAIFPGKLLAQAPAITSFSPATGPVGTLVTINGTNLGTPTAFTIGGQNAIVVSNTGSVLVGMVMPNAATGAVSITTAGGTASGSGNFTVTATKYPSVQQGAKLAGTGNTGTALQGVSVAVSADGNTAVLGGSSDNSDVGAAWVFVRNGGAWMQQGSKLVGTGAIGAASQGSSVALNADGNTAIIGGAGDNNSTGAAWVFTRSGNTWSQQGLKLVGTGAVGAAGQGNAVSISADGNTAIVGGSGDNSGVGAAWVFTRSGNTWTQQGSKLVGTGYTDTELGGCSVALSADGNTAIVGGSQSNSSSGAAWVYARSGGAWSQQTAMVAGQQTAFGTSVSLSADGNTAVIGAPSHAPPLPNTGGLWVYVRSGGAWTRQGSKIEGTSSVGRSPQLGWTVSVSADGNTAITAGYSDNANNGAAWIFTRSDGAWAQVGPKIVGTSNIGAAFQGYSVSISADGSTALSGGPDDNANLGAAWVFVTAPPNDALLKTIALSPYTTLTNTGTTGGTTTYTTTAGNGTTSVTVTPTTQDPAATVKVNGVTILSGTASGSIALGAEGTATTINTVVTARDGVTTHTYSITINRAPSFNALLSLLSLTPAATLTNTGTAGNTTTYTTSVSNGTAWVTVTPTAQDADATIIVNGKLVTSGTASGNIALAVGQNTINTVVTAQGGTATHTYSIIVTRAPSSNARLSTIKLTPASALTNTGTSGGTTTYTTTVSNATASVTVTPTAQDNTATITVNGITVASGTASGSIPLAVGPNTITTVVTAQDGTTMLTYSITITRLSNNALLSIIKLTPASTLTNTGTTGSTTTYTTTVSSVITSVTVTPTAQDATATIKVNNVPVISGSASGSIALGAEGTSTIINTVVTSQDGTVTHTYSIIITRAPSNNALLSTLSSTPATALANGGTVGSTTTYTASVSNATTLVTVTPTTQDANATVKVNGVAVTSGTASGSIALAVGQTTITTIVTAQDGTTTHTYLINVTRATGPLMSLYTPISVLQPKDNLNIENDGVIVHQGISPNGDGLNDFLIIDGIIAHPDNTLQIIDRSGTLIYQAKGYNNITKVFDGHSGINGRMQQPGTYFYSLDYVVDGQNTHKTGFILLKY